MIEILKGWSRLFKAELRKPRVSVKFEFREAITMHLFYALICPSLECFHFLVYFVSDHEGERTVSNSSCSLLRNAGATSVLTLLKSSPSMKQSQANG